VVLAALGHYGWPSLTRARAGLDRALGTCTNDILAARCNLVAGGYWETWPAVFHANLALHERRLPGTVWGIAPRGTATQSFWQHLPPEKLRVAVPRTALDKADAFLRDFGLPPMEVAEERATILVLQPRSRKGPSEDATHGDHRYLFPR
jgi:hypothetical protein